MPSMINIMSHFVRNNPLKEKFRNRTREQSLDKKDLMVIIENDGNFSLHPFVDDPGSPNNARDHQIPWWPNSSRRGTIFINAFYDQLKRFFPKSFPDKKENTTANFQAFLGEMSSSLKICPSYVKILSDPNVNPAYLGTINNILNIFDKFASCEIEPFNSKYENLLKKPKTMLLFYYQNEDGKLHYVFDFEIIKQIYMEWFSIFELRMQGRNSEILKHVKDSNSPFHTLYSSVFNCSELMSEESDNKHKDIGNDKSNGLSLSTDKKECIKYGVERNLHHEYQNNLLSDFNNKINYLMDKRQYFKLNDESNITDGYIFIEECNKNIFSENRSNFLESLKNLNFNLDLDFDFHALHISFPKGNGMYNIRNYKFNTEQEFKQRYEKIHFYYDRTLKSGEKCKFSLYHTGKLYLEYHPSKQSVFDADYYKSLFFDQPLPSQYRRDLLNKTIAKLLKQSYNRFDDFVKEAKALLQLFFRKKYEATNENGDSFLMKTTVPFKLGRFFAIVAKTKNNEKCNFVSQNLSGFLNNPRRYFTQLSEKIWHFEKEWMNQRSTEIRNLFSEDGDQSLFDGGNIPQFFNEEEKADFCLGLFYEINRYTKSQDSSKNQ